MICRFDIDRSMLIAGGPCFVGQFSRHGVNVGSPFVWSGFETAKSGARAVFCKTSDRRAWLEFHGDRDGIREGGRVVTADSDETVQIGWRGAGNLLPVSEYERLRATPGLIFGAVNRSLVLNGRPEAATLYGSDGQSGLLSRWRMDGLVRSVVMNPPVSVEQREPLNVWVETQDGRVELG